MGDLLVSKIPGLSIHLLLRYYMLDTGNTKAETAALGMFSREAHVHRSP